MGYHTAVRVEATRDLGDWIDALKDLAGRARIQVRIDRLLHGNPGQHRRLTEGLSELKIAFGPGYRIYYTIRTPDFCCCSSVAISHRRART